MPLTFNRRNKFSIYFLKIVVYIEKKYNRLKK